MKKRNLICQCNFNACILPLIAVLFIGACSGGKSNGNKSANKNHSGAYRNLFLEAGYSQAEIDAKVEKACHDLFEGPDRIYFEVGDSMAYVSNTKKPEELVPDPEKTKEKLKLLWISCGDEDRLITISKRTSDYLKANDVLHIYYVDKGNHDFNVWKNSLYMFSQLLFKPVDIFDTDK